MESDLRNIHFEQLTFEQVTSILDRNRRDVIFNFIKAHFTKEDLEKFKCNGEMLMYVSYEEFLRSQHQEVENLQGSELEHFYGAALRLSTAPEMIIMNKVQAKTTSIVIDGFIIRNKIIMYTNTHD